MEGTNTILYFAEYRSGGFLREGNLEGEEAKYSRMGKGRDVHVRGSGDLKTLDVRVDCGGGTQGRHDQFLPLIGVRGRDAADKATITCCTFSLTQHAHHASSCESQ